MTTNDGGPAFPSPALDYATDGRKMQRDGMSLRDWFAGQALAGMLADNKTGTFDDFAMCAYRQADAMLAERAKDGAK